MPEEKTDRQKIEIKNKQIKKENTIKDKIEKPNL